MRSFRFAPFMIASFSEQAGRDQPYYTSFLSLRPLYIYNQIFNECCDLTDCIKFAAWTSTVCFNRRIGELGPIQLKLLVLFGLPHIWGGLSLFSLIYVGADPGWQCRAVAGRGGHVGVAVENLTDPLAKCAYYEQGECIPEYSKEYTSIVTEVIAFNN